MRAKNEALESGIVEVEAYLVRVPEPARALLEKIRSAIRAAAPKQAVEGLSYRVPAFHYKGALVAYAAFKKHCSFFPMGSSILDEFAEELKAFRTSKGTLQFPLDKAPPLALIRRIVKARVEQNEAKAAR